MQNLYEAKKLYEEQDYVLTLDLILKVIELGISAKFKSLQFSYGSLTRKDEITYEIIEELIKRNFIVEVNEIDHIVRVSGWDEDGIKTYPIVENFHDFEETFLFAGLYSHYLTMKGSSQSQEFYEKIKENKYTKEVIINTLESQEKILKEFKARIEKGLEILEEKQNKLNSEDK